METKLLLGLIGIIFSFLQYIPYIIDVLKKKTKPHMFTWLVWGIPTFVVFSAQLINGSGISAWTTGFTAFFCTLIFLLAIRFGFRDFTRLDFFCLVTAIVAILFWIITKNPLYSVMLISFSDLIGTIPTMRKTLVDPNGETLSSYILGGTKWLFAIFAIKEFIPVNYIYPIAMVISNYSVVFLIYYSKNKNKLTLN